MNKSNRRDFIKHVARAGMLVPFAGHLMGRSAFAAGLAKRVVFLYYPNGYPVIGGTNTWQPNQGSGSIKGTSSALSFCLDPIKQWHDNVVVCKNMYVTGSPAGGHDEASQNCMMGKSGADDSEATVDHVLASKLGCDVAMLGVRTGTAADHMVSKPYGASNKSRPIPQNDPKSAADFLFSNLSSDDSNNTDATLRTAMLDTIMTDLDALQNLNLKGMAQTKADKHVAAVERLKSQVNQTIGSCDLVKTTVTDPYKDGATAADYEHWRVIDNIAKAQIDNVVGALACNVTKVATLQMMRGGENPNLANYCFDACWNHIQEASNSGLGGVDQRWWNEHSSHTASHKPGTSHAGQARWYVELFAYMLEQLKAKGILDDTLVVMMSEVGDGNLHGPTHGGVLVGGGAGGGLEMGRIVDCANGKSTQQLFVDLGSLTGSNLQGTNGWGSGGILI